MTYQQVFLIRSTRLVPLTYSLLGRSIIFVSAVVSILEDSALAGVREHSPYDNAEAVLVGRLRAKHLEEPL